MGGKKRACNLGKVPPASIDALLLKMEVYVDSVPEADDDELFSVGSYLKKGRHRYDLKILLQLQLLIMGLVECMAICRFLPTQLQEALIKLYHRIIITSFFIAMRYNYDYSQCYYY